MKNLIAMVVVLLLASCASSNYVQFYALQSNVASTPVQPTSNQAIIGISRVIVPDFLKNQGVTSLANDTGRLNIAINHAWAGELDTQLTQVIAQNISKQVNHSGVWPSPWPHGVKPSIRVQIMVEHFAGTLIGNVELRAKWLINHIDKDNNLVLASGLFSTTVAIQPVAKKQKYGAYTHAMSDAVVQLSQALSDQLKQYLN